MKEKRKSLYDPFISTLKKQHYSPANVQEAKDLWPQEVEKEFALLAALPKPEKTAQVKYSNDNYRQPYIVPTEYCGEVVFDCSKPDIGRLSKKVITSHTGSASVGTWVDDSDNRVFKIVAPDGAVPDGQVKFVHGCPPWENDKGQLTDADIARTTKDAWENICSNVAKCAPPEEKKCEIWFVVDGEVRGHVVIDDQGQVVTTDPKVRVMGDYPKLVIGMTATTATQFAFDDCEKINLEQVVDGGSITFHTDTPYLAKNMKRAILLEMMFPEGVKGAVLATKKLGRRVTTEEVEESKRQYALWLKDQDEGRSLSDLQYQRR